jgi:hypothetical protein
MPGAHNKSSALLHPGAGKSKKKIWNEPAFHRIYIRKFSKSGKKKLPIPRLQIDSGKHGVFLSLVGIKKHPSGYEPFVKGNAGE